MNTPAHAIVNLLLVDRADRGGNSVLPVALGGVLPDLAMVLFYAYYKLVLGASEFDIWSRHYWAPQWQAIFDGSHSFVVLGLATLVAYALRWRILGLVLVSMLLHALMDLPFHHDDAHRHLYPLVGWRFVSPISYWDPSHHGVVFTVFELAAVAVGAVILLRRYKRLADSVVITALTLSYFVFVGFALVMWVGLDRDLAAGRED